MSARQFCPSTVLKGGLALCIAVLLGGCAWLAPVDTSTSRTYVLAPHTAPYLRHRPALARTLLLTLPKAHPAYRDERMAYRVQPYRVDYFAHNHWVAPPAKMLLPVVQAYLQKSRLFQSVTAVPVGGLSDYQLSITVMTIEQKFANHKSYAKLSLLLEWVNTHTHQVTATHQLTATVPAKAATPYAGVVALNQGLAKLLPRIAQFCLRHAR